MITTKSDIYRLHFCNNYDYNFFCLGLGRFYPVEGKVCQLTNVKEFDDHTQYHFSDWRLANGKVYTVYHNADAEVARFEVMVDWCQDRVLRDQKRICQGKDLETVSKCEITDAVTINEWKLNKSSQDKDVAEFYEARPHLNHD
tara:strand:+ start:177 stop:605 length:429 start_codon:yes stop_codon:yes gene_type:complete